VVHGEIEKEGYMITGKSQFLKLMAAAIMMSIIIASPRRPEFSPALS
jgi:hypothetical protein